MTKHITENALEQATLDWFKGLDYAHLLGSEIEGDLFAERASSGDVVLYNRLKIALTVINTRIPAEARDEAFYKVTRADSPNLLVNNHRFHRLLTEGVDVEYRADGRIVHDKAWLIDFENPGNNDWLVVNQFTVTEGQNNRRPDVVVFVNGLPLGVIELKNPGDENATIKGAYNQLQTYKKDIASLFPYNELLVISDGLEARAGTLTANWERFMPWRTIDGKDVAPKGSIELEVLLKGIFDKRRFLDLIRNFMVYEIDGASIVKKMAGYHQYHAVNKAVDCTVAASSPEGDKRIGVVWHTQGSGKSLSMVFFAGKIIKNKAMANPTLVVLTDRNDLDDQLFDTFASCQEILRQKPVQAESREHLKELLNVAAGGVIFTTIQKFAPQEKGETYQLLSDRRNIVFIADEAHRSQYDFIDGFAKHMRDGLPNASFIGFTGTPIESTDRSTPAVFGNYIDVYDIQRAVEDGATVRIYYEGRLAKIELRDEERPKIDPEFEEVTEGQEVERKEKLKSRWARLEAMVGTEKRLGLVAEDLVDHFERRLDVMDGKAMVVCMSRRICVDMYNEIVKLRPEWHSDDDAKGTIKVVMTGSAADIQDWQPHIRNKPKREALRKRFKNEHDPMKLVIVRDMWLTGFDAPCLHTMYVDKPMRGHGLMQAIARVNRVFRDKPGGLVVDYLGLADQLKKALADYTESGGKGKPTFDQDDAVRVMLEKYEVVKAMLYGFDYSKYFDGVHHERLQVLSYAKEHILDKAHKDVQDNVNPDTKLRFMKSVTELSQAFALSVPHDEALNIRDDVGFFLNVRAGLAKMTSPGGSSEEELETAIKQIISKAVSSDEVVDIFASAGLKKPDISILSDEFLAEVQNMPQRNLALELLKKLLNEETKIRSRKNLVQSRSFAEMLEKTIIKYQNRSIETAQVIAELVELAKHMRDAHSRGEELGLSEDELAFYDALEVNDSAVQVLGDDTLKAIARELVEKVKTNTTIDWTVKESVRAKLRLIVKKLLKKHGYPPDKQAKATETVLEQAELLCKDWAA